MRVPTLSGAAGAGLTTHVDEIVGLMERSDLRDVVLVGTAPTVL